MPILNENESPNVEVFPGFERRELVSGELGAESLTVAHATLHPDGEASLHTHPTEEAMVILEGEAVAWLGDDEVVVRKGQTVLAPAGVKHGFVNRSGKPARIMAIFPTGTVERTSWSSSPQMPACSFTSRW